MNATASRVAFFASCAILCGCADKSKPIPTTVSGDESPLARPSPNKSDIGQVTIPIRQKEKWLGLPEFKEHSLGKLPVELANKSLAVSPDGRRMAYTIPSGSKWIIVVDNVRGSKKYDKVDEIVFSPDGQKWACRARRNLAWMVVIDDQEGNEYKEILCKPVFSSNGKHIAYLANKNDRRDEAGLCVVLDKKEFTDPKPAEVPTNNFSSRNFSQPVLSPDGKQIAFISSLATDNGGLSGWLFRARIILNGVALKQAYSDIQSLQFSPDGTRLGYIAKKADGGTVVVVGDVESPQYSSADKLTFSPDSKRIAFSAVSAKGGPFVVVDGKPLNDFNSRIHDIVFSSDSKRFSYSAYRNGKDIVVMNGDEQERSYFEFDIMNSSLRFSFDGQRVAFVARGENIANTAKQQWLVVDGGKNGKAYDWISARSLKYLDDTDLVAYVARRGTKWRMTIGGTESKEYDGFLYDGQLNFINSSVLCGVAIRDRELFRVEVSLTGN